MQLFCTHRGSPSKAQGQSPCANPAVCMSYLACSDALIVEPPQKHDEVQSVPVVTWMQSESTWHD
jgi:hypothetical protein